MKKNSIITLCFYQEDKLASVRTDKYSRRIFRAPDLPLVEQQLTDKTTNGLLATDQKGSVLRAKSVNDEETHTYSPYGQTSTLPALLTLLGFNGEAIEPSVNSYLLGSGHRIYNPSLMRFYSPDQLSPFAAGGINSYMYCNGDPIGKIDPSGRVPIFLKPLSSLYKGIKKRFFGRIPKSQRATSSPPQAATPNNRSTDSERTPDPFIQSMARHERADLHRRVRRDIAEAKAYDLTTVPPEILKERLRLHEVYKNRIKLLTLEYKLEPLGLTTGIPSGPMEHPTTGFDSLYNSDTISQIRSPN